LAGCVVSRQTQLGNSYVILTGGKAVLDGFTPGTIIWGCIRKIGTGGEVGDWSDPTQTRAS
jgi:hypothetical protein